MRSEHEMIIKEVMNDPNIEITPANSNSGSKVYIVAETDVFRFTHDDWMKKQFQKECELTVELIECGFEVPHYCVDSNAKFTWTRHAFLEGVVMRDCGWTDDDIKKVASAFRRLHSHKFISVSADREAEMTTHIQVKANEFNDISYMNTLNHWKYLRSSKGEEAVMLHGDINNANFIRRPCGNIAIIDWANAGLGDRHLDLAGFRKILTNQQWKVFKQEYENEEYQIDDNMIDAGLVLLSVNSAIVKRNA